MLDVLMNAVQWPAMAATPAAGWLVASKAKRRRGLGFWIFILSNALWVLWGWHDGAYALIMLQLGLFVLNVRGAHNNDANASASRQA